MYQTVIVSDLHLSDVEHLDRERPLWKLYKRRELFFDTEFINCIKHRLHNFFIVDHQLSPVPVCRKIVK